MGLLLVAAVVLLVAALVLRSAHPNRALLVAGVAIAGAVAGLVLYLVDRDRDAPAAIALSELSLSDVRITQDRYGQQLSGAVHNGSTKRLGTLTLKVSFKRCAPEGACENLGEESPRIFLALPPGQTNGFSILLTKAAVIEQPGVSWDCVIAGAQTDF